MAPSRPHLLRTTVATVAALVLTATLVATTGAPAGADIADDPSAAAQFTGGDVRALTATGNRLIVGGAFTGVTDKGTSNNVARPRLAALDARTGGLDAGFRPTVNGTVHDVASSTDGTVVYVAGEFTTVNGVSRRGVVALDARTGATVAGFAARTDDTVLELLVDGRWLYLGGDFSAVNGDPDAGHLARVDARTGALDTTWAPPVDWRVEAIAVQRSKDRVYVGGSFTSRPDFLIAVDIDSGDRVPQFEVSEQERVRDLEVAQGSLYAAQGGNPNYLVRYHLDTGAVRNRYQGNGDFQAVEVVGPRVVIGSHSTVFGNADRFQLAAIRSADASFTASLDSPVRGPLGVLAVYSHGRSLYAGGDINRAGEPPVSSEGLARFGPAPGQSGPTTPAGLRATVVSDGVELRWNASSDDGGVAGYRLLRGGEQVAWVTTGTSYTDRGIDDGVSYAYEIEAFDGQFNGSDRSAPVTVAAGDRTGPQVAVTTPGDDSVVGTASLTIRGTSADPAGTAAVSVTVRHLPTGRYLRADGTLGNGPVSLPATVTAAAATTATWTRAVTLPESGDWQVTATGTDGNGNVSAPARSTFGLDPTIGYWLVEADGGILAFGGVADLGGVIPGGATVVSMDRTPDARGLYVLDDAGTVHVRGSARHLGDLDRSTLRPGERAASISATPDGEGYWIFTDRGRVATFGNATAAGDLFSVTSPDGRPVADVLNGPVVASVATPDGGGYYMVASDGGVFAFGTARFAGSMGGTPLNAPVVSLAPDPDGGGYWLIAGDGGIFAFDAPFRGSVPGVLAPGVSLNQPVIGGLAYGNGYVMVASDGGVFVFSDLDFSGSAVGRIDSPLTDVASFSGLPR